MIKNVEIGEVQIVYTEIPLKEFIHDHARFMLFDPIPKQWSDIYELPKGKRVIYVYYENYDSSGDSTEHEVGFLVLELEEFIEDRHLELKEFCIAHLDRIIHANPNDR